MRNKQVIFITQAAVIAAIYVVLTLMVNTIGLANDAIQIRVSEALCILPYFTPAAIPGLFIGCIISNIMTGCIVLDIIAGSFATLLAATCTYFLRKHKLLCTLPPVLANGIIVPLVLIHGYGIPNVVFRGVDVTYVFTMATVAIGEIVSVCIIGSILLRVLDKYKYVIFANIEEK